MMEDIIYLEQVLLYYDKMLIRHMLLKQDDKPNYGKILKNIKLNISDSINLPLKDIIHQNILVRNLNKQL